MVLLYSIAAVILLFVILLFTVASRIIFHFDSTTKDVDLSLLWLYPLLSTNITSQNNRFMLSVYLFNKRVLRRAMRSNRMTLQYRDLVGKINPTHINIDAEYGFRDPSFTGLAFGAASMIPNFFSVESLDQRPNFLSERDYVNVDATARLNIGRSLLKLV